MAKFKLVKNDLEDENPNRPGALFTRTYFLSSGLSKHKRTWTVYKTKDLGEASAILASKKARFIKLEPEQEFYWFVFDNHNICSKVSNAYWNNELLVHAKDLIDAMRTLKDRLFAGK